MTVRDGLTPVVGVRVLFQGADDGVIAEATTGIDGTALAEMPDGGSVTVIRRYLPPPPPEEPRPDELYTYVGVKSGDRLVLGNAVSEALPSAINVKVPEAANGTVRISTPCGAGEGQGPLVPITTRGCGPEVTFYVSANGQSFVKRAAYSENVDLSLEGLNEALSSTLSASNVPPGANVTIEKRLQADNYTLFSTNPKRVDGGPATVDLPRVSGLDDLTLTMVQQDGHTQVIATRSPYSPGTSVVDASAGLIANVARDATLVTPLAISWTEEGAGTADVVQANVTVDRGDNRFLRAFVAPHEGLSMRIPQLAGVDAIYNVSTLDQTSTAIGIASVTGGYDAVRARAFAVDSLAEATPMSGLVTLSYTGTAPGR